MSPVRPFCPQQETFGGPVGVLDRDPQLLRHDPARVIGRAVWRLGATEQQALLAALDALAGDEEGGDPTNAEAEGPADGRPGRLIVRGRA